MRIPIFCIFKNFEMTSFNQDVSGESRIGKMKKFLSSPLTRKKPSGSQSKTFGTSLDVLIQRTPSETPVPYIVTRICQYIENTGLFHEGLFRISGNARLIERLKSCFDQSGDAPLETEGDVASAAALLKLFLRELPDPIIPLAMHQQFLNAVKEVEKDESIKQLMLLVEKLPFANYSLLKYLSYFLMQVSQYEEQNRMSASSLGIVFGPNLFRVAEDFVGLKEQSLTNQIVTYFITDYFAIFHNEPEHLGKSSQLTTSFDSSMKHNHISLDVTHSMVSSWPKLSSFPSSFMSSLSMRPLSVSIPSSESYQISVNVESSADNEEHILMVDDAFDNGHTPTYEQGSDQSDKEENKGFSTNSSKRKRKDRKLLKEDVVASYSALHDVSQFAAIDDDDDDNVFSVPKTVIHSITVDSIADTANFQFMDSDEGCAIQSDGSLLRPEANATVEPVLDPQKGVTAQRTDSNFTTHEAQRNAERKALRASPQRNRSLPKSLPTHAKLNGDCANDAKCCPSSDLQPNISIADSAASTRAAASVATEANAHSFSAMAEQPFSPIPEANTGIEKRFSSDHKHQRYARGHRGLYYKKHQSELKKEDEATLKQLQTEKLVVQLDGLKSPLDSDEDVESSKMSFASSSEFDVSAGSSSNENDGANSDQRYSWPILKWLQDSDHVAASPTNQFLRISSSTEAPLSPSAYRSYLSHRSPHLDPNMPPSPPVEQEDLATGVADECNKAAIKQLSKKIQSIKRKIKHFEESFEATHGYRPSYAEKSYYPDMKKVILELNQARQELKQLKEPLPTTMLGITTPHSWSPCEEDSASVLAKLSKSTNTCKFGACLGPVLTDGATVTIEESLNEALKYLEEKRKGNERPDALEDMSREQLVDEKFTIQKLLLQFESIHGRPSSKLHRDLMRPLYDRYRSAKRILARSASFGSLAKGKDSVELQPILEHETMDFRSSESKMAMQQLPIVINENVVEKNENEVDKEINEAPTPVQSTSRTQVEQKFSTILKPHTNLHELSLPELFEQQQHARAEKRRLRGILREFETHFFKENGRKIQREDKVEMESVYGAYKNIRAKMKLLEALATKHDQSK